MSKDGLLCIERIVLESLSQKPKTLFELATDTSLNCNVINNIVFELMHSSMIEFNGSKYSLNKKTRSEWIKKINDKNHIKEEVKELFSSLVNKYFMEEKLLESTRNLKMKKVWMTEREDKIFQTLLGNLKTFLDNVQDQRKKENLQLSLSKQRVIIWGHSEYSDLIDGVMNSI